MLLGGACPDNEQQCPFVLDDANVVDAGARTDANAATDARRPDSRVPSREDAQSPEPEPDAEQPDPDPVRDAGPPKTIEDPNGIIDRLDNLSFELTPDSQPGDVAVINLPLQPSQTRIDPWYTCQIVGTGMTSPFTGVRAESAVTLTDSSETTVQASKEDTFLSIQYTLGGFVPVPVLQELQSPLPAGSHVRFAIDACTNDATAPLSMQVLGATGFDRCLTELGERTTLATKTVSGTTWQTLCFDFTTPAEIRYLGFVPGLISGVEGLRLFLDNMRSTDECPSN